MPIGTGYTLEAFSIGDVVIIKHMFNGEENEVIPLHYGEFNPIGVAGTITQITGANFPLRVNIEDAKYFADMGRNRFDVFKPNELAPINRDPDWEI